MFRSDYGRLFYGAVGGIVLGIGGFVTDMLGFEIGEWSRAALWGGMLLLLAVIPAIAYHRMRVRLQRQIDRESASHSNSDLEEMLLANVWYFFFRPGRYKDMRFGARGIIPVGSNQQESTWRWAGEGVLEFVRVDGHVNNRFLWSPEDYSFRSTNEADVVAVKHHDRRDQYLTKRKPA